MNARSWSAPGDWAMFSAVRHSTHITSSSTSGSVVFGSAAAVSESSSTSASRTLMRAPSAAARCSSSHAWSIGPRLERDDPALAVDQERLGVAADAEVAPVLAVAVAQARERDPLLAQERERLLGRLLRVDPSTRPPRDAIFSCVRWSSGISDWHGAHHDAHAFSTTTLPAWSATEPVPSAPSRGRSFTGASTRLPSRSAESSEVSGPTDATPYVSSATSAAAANVTGQ